MEKVIVYHGGYGCETGCCGHWIEMGDSSRFEFDHPDEDDDPLLFAKQLVLAKYGEEHVKDLDWDNCQIVSLENCYNW